MTQQEETRLKAIIEMCSQGITKIEAVKESARAIIAQNTREEAPAVNEEPENLTAFTRHTDGLQ